MIFRYEFAECLDGRSDARARLFTHEFLPLSAGMVQALSLLLSLLLQLHLRFIAAFFRISSRVLVSLLQRDTDCSGTGPLPF